MSMAAEREEERRYRWSGEGAVHRLVFFKALEGERIIMSW